MEEFTVVMPIHNEEKFLPLSLPSIYNLRPNEVILIFDRCTDKSFEIAKELTFKHQFYNNTKFIEITENNNWRMRFSFLRCLGIDNASNDINLVTAGDIILDSRIVNHISKINKFPFISFNHIDFPVNFRNLIIRFLDRITLFVKKNKFSGIFLVNRQVMYECEDRKKLKQLEYGEDSFLHYCIKKRYLTNHVTTNSIHLRPRNSAKYHYLEGYFYWICDHGSFVKAILVGIITFKFSLIKGYIHARFKTKR